MADVVKSLVHAFLFVAAMAIAAIISAVVACTVLAIELLARSSRGNMSANRPNSEMTSKVDPRDLEGRLIIDGEYRVL